MDLFDFLNKDKIYKEEAGSVNDRRTDIEFDTGDRFRQFGASLFGRGDEFSKEALLEGSRKKIEEELKDEYGGRIRTLQDDLQGVGLESRESFDFGTKKDSEIKNQILQERGRATAGENYLQLDGAKVGDLDSDASRSAITGAGRALLNKRDADPNVIGSNADVANQRQINQDRLTLAENRAAFDRAENRKMQANQFDMNMLNKNAQLDLQRLELSGKREDRRMAREDRQADKRQASIMMLIKGLSQLGAGFSI